MKSFAGACLLILTAAVRPLAAVPSPVPVVTIEKVSLPKVTIRISNPGKTKPCIIWKDWHSWGEQNKWFSLRDRADGTVWELRPAFENYTVNFAEPEIIPPGGSLIFKCRLSKKSWRFPNRFVGGKWNYDVQAHLEIRPTREARRFGVFTGHVTSGWYDRKGRNPGTGQAMARTSRPRDGR